MIVFCFFSLLIILTCRFTFCGENPLSYACSNYDRVLSLSVLQTALMFFVHSRFSPNYYVAKKAHSFTNVFNLLSLRSEAFVEFLCVRTPASCFVCRVYSLVLYPCKVCEPR